MARFGEMSVGMLNPFPDDDLRNDELDVCAAAQLAAQLGHVTKVERASPHEVGIENDHGHRADRTDRAL